MQYELKQWESQLDNDGNPIPNSRSIRNAKSWIDLTKESDVRFDGTPHGLALASTEESSSSTLAVLGNDTSLKNCRLTQYAIDAIQSLTGITVEGATLADAFHDYLNLKSDYTGQANVQGLTLSGMFLDLYLDNTSQKRLAPFVAGTQLERRSFARLITETRAELNRLRTLAEDPANGLPVDIHRKALTAAARKLAVSPSSLKPKNWRSNETPLEPTTQATSSFPDFTSFTKVTGAGTWTASNGLYCTRTGFSALLDTVKHNTAMSIADHDTTLVMPTPAIIGNGNNVGPICRLGSSGSACYMLCSGIGGGSGVNPQLVRFAASSNGYTHLALLDFISYATVGQNPSFLCGASGTLITGKVFGNNNNSTAAVTNVGLTTGNYGGAGCRDDFSASSSKIADSIIIDDYAVNPPVVTSASASGTKGKSFSYQIIGTNSPTSYSATGLPTGLSCNISTGAITGTPTQAGSFSVSIAAGNTGGTGTGTLSLTIKSPLSPEGGSGGSLELGLGLCPSL